MKSSAHLAIRRDNQPVAFRNAARKRGSAPSELGGRPVSTSGVFVNTTTRLDRRHIDVVVANRDVGHDLQIGKAGIDNAPVDLVGEQANQGLLAPSASIRLAQAARHLRADQRRTRLRDVRTPPREYDASTGQVAWARWIQSVPGDSQYPQWLHRTFGSIRHGPPDEGSA